LGPEISLLAAGSPGNIPLNYYCEDLAVLSLVSQYFVTQSKI